MGKSGNSSGGSSSSAISREQAKILSTRNAEYQAYYQPILRQELAQTAQGGAVQSRLADHAVGAVNQQYNQAKGNLVQSLDQREVEGGFRNSALASLEVARANASSDAQANAFAQAKQQRSDLLQMSMGMAPTPTQSVGYHQNQKSKTGGLMSSLFT